MKLLLDEMFVGAVAVALRARGHDVVSVVDDRSDLRNRPDAEVFNAAQEEQRAVVTENVADFVAVASAYQQDLRSHWGLILTSNRSFPRHRPEHAVKMLVAALDALLATRADDDKPTSEVVWLRPTV